MRGSRRQMNVRFRRRVLFIINECSFLTVFGRHLARCSLTMMHVMGVISPTTRETLDTSASALRWREVFAGLSLHSSPFSDRRLRPGLAQRFICIRECVTADHFQPD